MIPKLRKYVYKGFVTDYYASPFGNVYSNKSGKLYKLKQTKTKRGYVKVRLCIHGKIYNRNVHRIIAETFIPNPDNKPEVNHKDGNKKNNNYRNLEWSTRKENAQHAYDTGLFGIGENFPTSDITNEQCIKICELIQNTDIPLSTIAEIINCGPNTVYYIFNKRTWTYISDNYDFSHRPHPTYITESIAEEICKLLTSTTYSSKDIADIVGCKRHHVKDIKRGKTWKRVSKKYGIV